MRKTLVDLIASIALSASAVFSGCSLPQKIDFDEYKESKVRKKTLNVDCAILVSAPDEWWEYFRVPFEFIYEYAVVSAIKEHQNINNYVISYSAGWDDLKTVLKDSNVQTVVVAGHGRWSGWCSTSGDISEESIFKFMSRNNVEKKKGLFIRHTCSGRRYAKSTLLDKSELDNLTKDFMKCGINSLLVNLTWDEDDEMFAKKIDRISYTAKHNKEQVKKVADYWNEKIASNGRRNEVLVLGASVTDDQSKIRCYEGIVGPLDYIFNPIPAPSKVKTNRDF